MLTDGAVIHAVEPKDIADLLNEIQPVLAAVKQTLLRVEGITQDLQGSMKAGGRALEQVSVATQELPALVASVKRTVASVEETTASLPDMTASVKRTLGIVDRMTADVQQATRRLPAVIDSTQTVLESVKTLSRSVNEMTEELRPVVQMTQSTLTDVSLLVRGAKNTFPFSRFVENAGPPRRFKEIPYLKVSEAISSPGEGVTVHTRSSGDVVGGYAGSRMCRSIRIESLAHKGTFSSPSRFGACSRASLGRSGRSCPSDPFL